jgi:hypothetical protein
VSAPARASLDLLDGPGILRRTAWKVGRVGGGRGAGAACGCGGSSKNLYSYSEGGVGRDWMFRYKGFSDSDEDKLFDAISFLYTQIHLDLAGRPAGESYLDRHERKNCTRHCPCCRGDNGRAWGGYNSGSPSALVDETFRKGKLKFRGVGNRTTTYANSASQCVPPNHGCWICLDPTGVPLRHSSGYTKCWDRGDAPDGEAKIYLCGWAFEEDVYSSSGLASTIAHEVLHALGADEKAAYEMDPDREDFTGGCDDATCQ